MTIDDYIKSLKQPLSGEETQKLFIAYKNGDINARQELIETNLRLVPYIIQRYYGNYVDSFEDYISVGNIALIKAIDNYDLSVGITFSTYASKSIINEITKYNNNNFTLISISETRLKQRREIIKFIKEFNTEYNRLPTFEEISRKLEIQESIVSELALLKLNTLSLDEIYGEESNARSYGDCIEDKRQSLNRVLDMIYYEEFYKLLKEIGLSNRYINMLLDLYYNNSQRQTIASKYNISKQRMYEIRNAAIKKIFDSKRIPDYIKVDGDDRSNHITLFSLPGYYEFDVPEYGEFEDIENPYVLNYNKKQYY